MVPVPIPADYVLAPYQRRLVIGPPDNDPTGEIRSVEALHETVDDGAGQYSRYRVLVEVEAVDWQQWGMAPPEAPARFWMVQLAPRLVPFALTTEVTR